MLLKHKVRKAVAVPILILALFATLPAAAADCTVTSNADDGAGSLRKAIQIGGCSSIDFALPSPTTINLTSGELVIDGALTIAGPGPESLIIDAGGSSRVFRITGAGPVEISGVTIQNGYARNVTGLYGFGGGVRAGPGTTLSLTNTTISGARAQLWGGGIYADTGSTVSLSNSTVSDNDAVVGGGIYTGGGQLILTNSTVSKNSSTSFGGGIYAYDGSTVSLSNSTVWDNLGNKGGGIFARFTSTVYLNNSTVLGNRSTSGGSGGGIYNDSGMVTLAYTTVSGNDAARGGGIYTEGGELILNNSTVSGNSSTSSGGGILADRGAMLTLTNSAVSDNSSTNDEGDVWGGGIFSVMSQLTLTNSTVSGNSSSGDGGGIHSRKSPGHGSSLTLTNSTVADNTSKGDGGGIYSDDRSSVYMTNTTVSGNSAVSAGGSPLLGGGIYAAYRVGMKNSLLANNGAGGNCYVAGGTMNSFGYNLSDDDTCPLSGTGDMINTPAGLDPIGLYDNGGPTETFALQPDSQAIDNGACLDLIQHPVENDQRGAPRPLGPGCDIGAFEFFIPVVIDIQPNSVANSINLRSGGNTPVAICSSSSPDFDPTTVNPSSLKLAGASVALKGKALTPMASYASLSAGACSSDNTYPDLVVHFDTQDLALPPDADAAFLTGMTATDPPRGLLGKDSVQIVTPGN